MLCLHLSCLFLLSASLLVYLLCVISDRHGNACLFTIRVHVVHLFVQMMACLCFGFNKCFFLQPHVSYNAFNNVPSAYSTYSCTLHLNMYPVTLCACDR